MGRPAGTALGAHALWVARSCGVQEEQLARGVLGCGTREGWVAGQWCSEMQPSSFPNVKATPRPPCAHPVPQPSSPSLQLHPPH